MNETQRSVVRYVDREMGRDEAVAFEARLREDAGLRRATEELRGLRSLFGPERAAAGPCPSSDFRARVLAAAAATAGRVDESAVAAVWGRRVLYAAAVIVTTTLVLAVGVLRRADSGRLEASPAEVERAMETLDARIRTIEAAAEGR